VKKALYKAYLNPFVRVIGFFVFLALFLTFWDAFTRDRDKVPVPATPLPHVLASHFAFSPDGKWAAGCSDDGKLYVAPVTLTGDSPKVGSPRLLPLLKDGLCAPFAWDPQSRRILMPYVNGSSDGSSPGFIVASVEGGEPMQLLNLEGGVDPNVMPAWSPDGESVAYVAGIRSVKLGGLWLIRLDRPEKKRLRLGVVQSPVFSVGGDRVFFEEDTALVKNAQFDNEMQDWPHVWSVASVPVNGGPLARLDRWTQGSLMPTNTALTVALSNGGVRYLRYFRNAKGSRLEIWDWNAGKSELKMKIALRPGFLTRDSRWSADGNRLTYLQYLTESGPNDLVLADVNEGTTRSLKPGAGAPDYAPPPGSGTFAGYYWSQPNLSPKGDWVGDTIASVVEAESDDSGDHDEDESPQLKIVSEKAQTLLLKAPR
jgi:hypothetical protein